MDNERMNDKKNLPNLFLLDENIFVFPDFFNDGYECCDYCFYYPDDRCVDCCHYYDIYDEV